MKRTFLYQVWQHDKRLFFVLAAFCLATLITNLLGDQISPFFVWGMYSEKEAPAVQYTLLRSTVNDSLVIDHSAGRPTGTLFYLQTPLSYYKQIKDNGQIDPTVSLLRSKLGERYEVIKPLEATLFNSGREQAAFLPWYNRYLQSITGTPVTSLTIDALQVHYDPQQQIITDTTYLFEQWKQP